MNTTDVLPTAYYSNPGWHRVFHFIWWGGIVMIPMTLACILWIDLPTATWIHQHDIDSHLWLRRFLDTPIIMTPLAAIYIFVYAVRRNWSQPGITERNWFIISVTLLAAFQVKNFLKVAFGRTWPRQVSDVTVSNVNALSSDLPSRGFINDGIHVFQAFGGSSKPFSAFPSGSTLALIVVLIPIVALYPRTRWPLLVFTAVSLVAFVLTNTHFIADVVAGIYVGAICGLIAMAIIEEKPRSTPLFKS